MANIRPKDLPAVTTTTVGDKVIIDGATARSITIENLFTDRAIIGATITTSTFNGNNWTAGTGTLTLGAGKTATVSNTLTLTGTDGSTVAFGAGGTVAYVANNLSVFAATTSAQLAGVISDETGSGALVFATSPTLVTPALGTPSAAVLTNATGLPLSGLTAQAAFTFVGNNTSGSAVPTAVDIAALTTKASPAAGDYVILSDQAASGAWKKAAVSSIASAGSVSSIAGNTGAFTLSGLLSNSVNDLRVLAATQAEQETGTSTTIAVTPGRQQFHQSAAKVWYKIGYSAGVPSVALAYNVSSVTDTATGRATVNFTTAFSSANYGGGLTSAAGVDNNLSDQLIAPATGSFEHRHSESGATLTDPVTLYGVLFGDQ